MQLGSVECKEALKNYEVKNEIEAEAIKVLLDDSTRITEKDGVKKLTSKIIDLENPNMMKIFGAILRIKKIIGIE